MPKKASFVVVVVIALILSVTTYAFAATNSMPTGTSAGDGEAAISGYTVAAVTYTLSTDPSTIDKVTFTLTPSASGSAATTAKIQLISSGTWYPCTISSGTATCTVGGGVTVLAASNLRVVAAQ